VLRMARVAKKNGTPLLSATTSGGIKLHFFQEEAFAKGERGGTGPAPRDTPAVQRAAGGSPACRSQDDPRDRPRAHVKSPTCTSRGIP
jgi:hypothetical protein